MEDAPPHPTDQVGRVANLKAGSSRRILDFLRKSGLIIPVADDCWIYAPSAEEQLEAMLRNELQPSQQNLEVPTAGRSGAKGGWWDTPEKRQIPSPEVSPEGNRDDDPV